MHDGICCTCMRNVLDDADGDLAPGVAGHDLLEERQGGRPDALEAPGAAVAVVPRERGGHGVHQVHRDDGPEEN